MKLIKLRYSLILFERIRVTLHGPAGPTSVQNHNIQVEAAIL